MMTKVLRFTKSLVLVASFFDWCEAAIRMDDLAIILWEQQEVREIIQHPAGCVYSSDIIQEEKDVEAAQTTLVEHEVVESWFLILIGCFSLGVYSAIDELGVQILLGKLH